MTVAAITLGITDAQLAAALTTKADVLHSHGNLDSSGAIGTTPNLPIRTGVGGVLQTDTIANYRTMLGLGPTDDVTFDDLTCTRVFVGGSGGPRLENNAGTVRFLNNAGSANSPVECGAFTARGNVGINPAADGLVGTIGFTSGSINLMPSTKLRWQSSFGAPFTDSNSDLGLRRLSAGVLQIVAGDGTTARDLDLRNITASGKIRSDAAIVGSNGVQGANGPSLEMAFLNYGFGANANGEPVSIVNGTVRNRLGVDVVVGSNGSFGFGSAAHAGSSSTIAANINYASPGVLQIGTTGNNALGSLNLANLTASGWIDGAHRPFTFAGLPLASASQNKTFVCTDSTLPMSGANYGVTPSGGGSNRVKVFSNGTNWVLG